MVLASALSGLASGLLNIGASAISSARSTSASKKLMYLQDSLNRAYTRDSYGLMREGLKKAGYNPLLALGSSANSSIPSASQGISDSDIGSQSVASAIDSLRLKNETKLRKSQVELNKSQEDLNTQNTYKTFADELKARADANVSSAMEGKILNDIRWDNILKDAEFKQIIANTKYTNERSRGFSASSSKNYSAGVSPFVKGGYSHSESKSW